MKSFDYHGRTFSTGTGTFKTNHAGMSRLALSGRLYAPAKALQYMRKVPDFSVVPVSDRWESVQLGLGLTYVVQTSVKVVERCLLMATDPGDLILDPTCGSGTTAVVAEQWGRRWITIDTSRVALALARARIMGARYERAVEKLEGQGARVRRVVLEEELKADYQRFLQRGNKGRRDARGEPERDQDAIALWAREHELPYRDGHVELPDARIEHVDREGRPGVEDIEIVTPHYRGAHAAAKAASGFSQYRSVGARVGGVSGSGRSGRGVDPRAAEDLLP